MVLAFEHYATNESLLKHKRKNIADNNPTNNILMFLVEGEQGEKMVNII